MNATSKETPISSLPSYYYDLLHRIRSLDLSKPVSFMTIWGASSTGKTVLARFLSSQLQNANMFSVDSYLSKDILVNHYEHTPALGSPPYIEGLDPNIWDLTEMNRDLKELAMGHSIQMPVYDYSLKRRTGYLSYHPASLIILEGAYSIENSIQDSVVLSVVLQANLHDRLIRKLVRTTRINKRNDIDSSISRYLLQTNSSLEYYTGLYTARADITLEHPLDPDEEFKDLLTNSSLPEVSYVSLIPRPATGHLRPSEELRFYNNHQLIYLVSSKIVFSVEVNSRSLELLSLHYSYSN